MENHDFLSSDFTGQNTFLNSKTFKNIFFFGEKRKNQRSLRFLHNVCIWVWEIYRKVQCKCGGKKKERKRKGKERKRKRKLKEGERTYFL